jgi:hypothetical protein
MSDTRRAWGLFFLSLASLLLELSLTRVLSVALWYHFGFLVISTALLGFGAAGATVASSTRLRERADLDETLALLSLLFAATTVIGFSLLQQIPFDPFALSADRRQLLYMPLYYVTIASPFYCAGLAFALLFTRGAQGIGRLYAFDLVGAGVGCGAVALVMPVLGGPGSILIVAALGGISAVLFAGRRVRLVAVGAGLAIACAALSPLGDRLVPIVVSPGKVPPRVMPATLYSAWNTFSKVDVIERPVPGKPWLGRAMIIDGGTAATGIRDLRPSVRAVLAGDTNDADFPSGVALAGKRDARVLILGSGGGGEILDALHYGAADITAVEINPIIVDVGARVMRDFWGGLFEQPGVHVVVGEARSFVRRSQGTWDAIISSHTISNAAVASGALSLAENYVLTREAFEDYLDHLSPDGILFFTRPEAQIARLFATARAVFERRGLGSPAAHLFAWRTPSIVKGRSSFGAGFLLKKSPFTDGELARVRAILAGEKDPKAKAEIIYAPSEPHPGSIYERIVGAPDVRAVYAAEAAILEPATDDKPFFNQHVRWSNVGWRALADVFAQKGYMAGRMALEDRPVAEVTLLFVLLQSIAVAALCILLPLLGAGRSALRAPSRWRFLTYFAMLGLGFIFVEIALLQRFTLYLGEPVYSLAVVLASLLVSTGAGAAVAGRLRGGVNRLLPLVLVAGAAVVLAASGLFFATLGWPLAARVIVAVALLAPLGFTLGLPFPTGLRRVHAEAPGLVPWAWGVNCFFTVIGTVTAQILGMALGFTAVLALAAAWYLVAWFALRGQAG